MLRRCPSTRLFVVVLAVLGCLLFTGQASASPGALKILLTDQTTLPTTLQSQLEALSGVARVDTFDTGTGTPSVAQLDAYDVVVVLSNDGFNDPVTMGNNLADYQDQGGVVVGGEFIWENTGQSYDLAGRWMTGGYSPYGPGNADFSGVSQWSLGPHNTTSPLLKGVSTLTAHYVNSVTLASGATQLGVWSSGDPAIAVKGDAVGINAYFGNVDCSTASSCWTGDYARIIVNAGNVLGRHTLTVTKGGTGAGTVTSAPAGISCGATCSVNYNNGTRVTLTAAAASGSSFVGWSGSGCSGTAACTVTMNAAASITANFKVLPPNGTKVTKAKIKKKKRTATFRFNAAGTVTGFQCALIKPKKGKHHKKAKVVFRSCSSPKTYKHLKPGKYTFEVRAVNSTGPDSKPAIKKFTI